MFNNKLDVNRDFNEKCFIEDLDYLYFTFSGSHLYGFPSDDSDVDIRGCHILPAKEVLGLKSPRDVIERTKGDVDFVSFDVKKELGLILSNNSNVLEHVFSPVFKEKDGYKILKKIAEKSISKLVYNPYHGLAKFNWHKYIESFNASFRKAPVKKYLYVLRSLMAGIYTLKEGKIEPNIVKLNKYHKLEIVDELIELKKIGKENRYIDGCAVADALIKRLFKDLDSAKAESNLPDKPPEEVFETANDFLIKCRFGNGIYEVVG